MGCGSSKPTPGYYPAQTYHNTYGGRRRVERNPPPRQGKGIALTRTAPSPLYETEKETRMRLEWNERCNMAHRVMGVDKAWRF